MDNYNLEAAKRYMQSMYPEENHNIGGDCINPKCDYLLTDGDWSDIKRFGGWFTCPQCDYSYNYIDPSWRGWDASPGGITRAGLTLDQMGEIGEDVVEYIGEFPGVGKVLERYPGKNHPFDFRIGPFGAEVKSAHSEAQPRFKVGGKAERQAKLKWAQQNGLRPALIGVRLNFYTDTADVFFREGLTDTWIGNGRMNHVATYNFRHLNPFRNPEDVPSPSEMPTEDDIPW